jgi:ribosomal protein S18 acetylase RimI-like enzyme
MQMRHLTDADYPGIIAVVNEWWGGRPMADMLPRLFFQHFGDTSFVVEEDGEAIGFLVGFVSQSRENEAYIHFVGVHPEHRKRGLGRMLYERFFASLLQRFDEVTVRCVTSPVNVRSVAFHQAMGFAIVPGEATENGFSVHPNYDGRGHARVLFAKVLKREGA